MAIGKRIKFFRNKKGLTQKELGLKLGFKGKTPDVRMAQYESESRIPKEDLLNALAYYLDVAPFALNVPDIDTEIGLMHTLFALEDFHGLTIDSYNDTPCLHLDPDLNAPGFDIEKRLISWMHQKQKLNAGEITRDEYDKWRYYYPEFDEENIWIKITPKFISDMIIDSVKKSEREEKIKKIFKK